MRIVILILNCSENWQNPGHFEGTYIFVEGLSNRNITIIFNKIICTSIFKENNLKVLNFSKWAHRERTYLMG